MIDADFFSEANILDIEPLLLLNLLGGYYECPKNAYGKRLGPLVGYTGKYTITQGSQRGYQKQFVGDVYANFAKAEEHPQVLLAWAKMLQERLQKLKPTVVMGMPMGGILSSLAYASVIPGCRCIFAEKKVTHLATTKLREQYKLVLGRHELRIRDRVLIGEDVCNNFSTTSEAIELIQNNGAEPVGICCWLNRSRFEGWQMLPVESLVFRSLPEYEQEDPAVVEDIAVGKIVLKPKDEWGRLMQAMHNQ